MSADAVDSVANFAGLSIVITNRSAQCNCSNPTDILFYHPSCGCFAEENLWTKLIPISLIYLLVFLVGLTGNTLVIFVVWNFKRMRCVTNIFLASLSIADLCLLLFCVPIQYLKFITFTWEMGEFLCYALQYVQAFAQACSVFTLTSISIERYVAIVYPLRAVWFKSIGRAKRVICVVWAMSTLMAVPSVIGTEFEEFNDYTNLTIKWCIRRANKTFNDVLYSLPFGLYQFLLILVIPVCTMLFCYSNIARVLHFHDNGPALLINETASRKESSSNQITLRKFSQGPNDQQTRKQIVHMLIAIVTLYVICWGPFVIDDLLVGFGILSHISQSPWLQQMRTSFAIMAYANSCVNPCVYAFMSRNFRNTFRLAFERCFCRIRDDEHHHGRKSSAYLANYNYSLRINSHSQTQSNNSSRRVSARSILLETPIYQPSGQPRLSLNAASQH